jgi:hypothetical protein
MEEDIYSLAQGVVQRYRDNSDQNDVVEGLSFDMYEHVREVEFFTSGHYMTGDHDEYGDLKPFHDITTRILENQRVAEEVDSADITITTDDSDYYTRAMLISKFNQDWLAHENIGKFLNDAIETRGKYGGLLVKVTETDDELGLEVVDWNSFAGDVQNLGTGIRVINHFYTPSELLKVASECDWDIDQCKEAIELYAEADNDEDLRVQKETTGKYVLVREVTGDLPETYIKENGDEFTYSHQIHYVAGTEFKDKEGNNLAKTLFSDELKQSPYYYLPYKNRGGTDKMLGIGMVERAKHAQVQSNRGAQQYKRSLDFASTHVLQTSSKNLKGKNVLYGMKTGTVLQTDQGQPISGVDMSPQALAHLGNYLNLWQVQVDKATGTYGVATGDSSQLPSDMPYRLGAILDQNAQAPSDLRREEFGIFLNQIYTERIIPFFIRQVKKQSVLKLKFNPEELMQMDADVAQHNADQAILDNYFNGLYDNLPTGMKWITMQEDKQRFMDETMTLFKRQKSRRTITDFPKGYWQDAADKLYVEVTNERKKKNAVLESINSVLLQYLQYKPQLDADPEARRLFNDIVQVAGMSPIDWTNTAPAQQQQAPQVQEKGKTAIDNPSQLTAKPM